MNDILNVYKKIGETPLEVIDRIREERGISKDTSMTYAGRLDPMAEGVLIVLSGDCVHKKDEYNKLDKEYQFEVLFGFSTDTYDLLGEVVDEGVVNDISIDAILEFIDDHTGYFEQEYPPFSSKPVQGKPLFEWAREGKIGDITTPRHKVQVAAFLKGEIASLDGKTLLESIEQKIEMVNGDFRQEKILKQWRARIEANKLYKKMNFRVVCGSGTYIRGLVHSLGQYLETPTTTFSIKRTRVGEYRSD